MADQNTDPGIARSDLYHIPFYENSPFNGSYHGMHYRIEGMTADAKCSAILPDNTEPVKGERQLRVTIWPGPYNYATTDDSKKVKAYFPFTNEGLDAITDYLNQYHREHF